MNPDEMIKGKVYFACNYETPSGLIPRIAALVYLGKNLHEKDSGYDEYYFQDPQTYFINEVTIDYVREEILKSGSGLQIIPEDSIHSVKTCDELIQWLTELRTLRGAEDIYKN